MMNERSVQPISSVRSTESSAPAARGQTRPEVDRSTKRAGTENAQTKHMSNISIHFNVDDETNRLIVVVTDRETGRLIRTIPAEEFEKLQAGDLLKLSA